MPPQLYSSASSVDPFAVQPVKGKSSPASVKPCPHSSSHPTITYEDFFYSLQPQGWFLEVVSVKSTLEVECDGSKTGCPEGLITDLAGESPRRYIPRHGARLHRDPAAGYRWLWPFHRSAPEATASVQLIHKQNTFQS